MTREEAIKSALKYLVHKQQEQGSWGYADNDNINKVPWDEALEWIDQQPCGDLISRQAAIDALSNMMDADGFRGAWFVSRANVDCMLRYLPSVAQTRWIPVSERLPEERDWYLAVFKESDTGFQLIPRVADYIGMGENKWQLMDEDGMASEYRDLLECIAWMPLPEPYKAESEE